MSFLSPWSAVAAAAVALPLLLLLYFLKLRRRSLRIPSTLLWQRSFEDLQVNAPFQRLRYSLLLLLQLLALLLLLLAAAQPVVRGAADPAPRVVLLIDRSASMSAVAGEVPERTRLDFARDAAREIVEGLTAGGAATDVMIVSFAASARVVSSFTSRRSTLLEAIAAIPPSDEPADLEAALRLAEAFGERGEEAGASAIEVILLSDGGVQPPEASHGFALQVGALRWVRVGPEPGEAVENAGIVAFSARRDHEDPARVMVFARLANAGAKTLETALTLLADGAVVDLQRLTLPPRREGHPGQGSTTFTIEHPGGAVLSLRQSRADQLAADDLAVMILPAPSAPRIALVHAGARPDPFLRDLLEATEPRALDVISAEGFAALDAAEVDGGGRYDLAVFDRVSGHRLPGVPSLTFGGVPAGMATTAEPPEGGRRLLSWRRDHPLLRHVSLDEIVYAGFSGYELPPAGEALALGPDGAVIATLRTRGTTHVMVGFELHRSTWPVDVSFAVFLQNALDQLAADRSGRSGLVHQPGEPVTVRAAAGADRLIISGPVDAAVAARPGEPVTLPELPLVGLYTVEGALPPMDRVAVSLLSDTESDIAAAAQLVVNARGIEAQRSRDTTPRPLWPWLVALAGVLLVVEWIVYLWKSS